MAITRAGLNMFDIFQIIFFYFHLLKSYRIKYDYCDRLKIRFRSSILRIDVPAWFWFKSHYWKYIFTSGVRCVFLSLLATWNLSFFSLSRYINIFSGLLILLQICYFESSITKIVKIRTLMIWLQCLSVRLAMPVYLNFLSLLL